ncbi:hypothetical protein BX600DRAFT_509773 [Xylariales sp. PMI_506]|nr:hypothetical protein BX600DRAFT_509773 [Xylariales sp. PMI_506]
MEKPDVNKSELPGEQLISMTVREVIKSLKKDQSGHGFIAMGRDGVLRTFAGDYSIVDARGLTNAQINELLDIFLPLDNAVAQALRGVDGSTVTTEEKLFHPDPDILPKRRTEEEKARRRKLVKEINKQREADGIIGCTRLN